MNTLKRRVQRTKPTVQPQCSSCRTVKELHAHLVEFVIRWAESERGAELFEIVDCVSRRTAGMSG